MECTCRGCTPVLLPCALHRPLEAEDLVLANKGLKDEDCHGLGSLRNLKMLQLGWNRLTCLPMGLSPSLLLLDLSHNKVESLAGLGVCKGLRVLRVGHNRITELSWLQGLRRLHELWVNGNCLELEQGLWVQELPCLEHVVATSNPMSTQPFYRDVLASAVPSLLTLDGKSVPAASRASFAANPESRRLLAQLQSRLAQATRLSLQRHHQQQHQNSSSSSRATGLEPAPHEASTGTTTATTTTLPPYRSPPHGPGATKRQQAGSRLSPGGGGGGPDDNHSSLSSGLLQVEDDGAGRVLWPPRTTSITTTSSTKLAVIATKLLDKKTNHSYNNRHDDDKTPPSPTTTATMKKNVGYGPRSWGWQYWVSATYEDGSPAVTSDRQSGAITVMTQRTGRTLLATVGGTGSGFLLDDKGRMLRSWAPPPYESSQPPPQHGGHGEGNDDDDENDNVIRLSLSRHLVVTYDIRARHLQVHFCSRLVKASFSTLHGAYKRLPPSTMGTTTLPAQVSAEATFPSSSLRTPSDTGSVD